MKKIVAFLVSFVGLWTAAMVPASAEVYPLEYWAVRDQMQDPQVSPDGKYVAYLLIPSKTSNPILEVHETASFASESRPDPFRAGGEVMEITSYDWVGDEEMIVRFRQKVRDRIDGFNQGVYDGRLALLNVDTGKFTALDNPNASLDGTSGERFSLGLAGLLPTDPDTILVSSRSFSRGSAFPSTDYYKYNLKNRRKSLVLKGNSDIFGVGFDFEGNPRFAVEVDIGAYEFVYLYRKPGERSWREIYRQSGNSFENFDIEGVIEGDPTRLYVNAHNGADKSGIWIFNTDTKQFEDLVFRHPEVDVSGMTRDSNSWANPGIELGVAYYKDEFKVEWFDTEQAAIEEATRAQIADLIPNSELVTITSRSRDGQTLVARNIGMKDPGSYYLLANGRFQYLGGEKPLLEAENLATRSYIQYPSRDGKMIPAFVHTPAKGSAPYPLIVLPHGGPFVREVVIWDEWAQMLANNGYMVIQPQYRGSRGYGLDFYTSAFLPTGQGGYAMQDDKDDGALYLVSQGLADRDRLAFFGWSYGGYAALISAARPNNIYQCAIAGAAVADNNQQVNYYRDDIRGSSRTEQLKFWDESISPLDQAAQVNIPLLVIHGDVDQRVPPLHARKYIKALEQAGIPHKYVELEGADHFSNTLFYRHKIKLYEEMISFLQNDCGPGGL